MKIIISTFALFMMFGCGNAASTNTQEAKENNKAVEATTSNAKPIDLTKAEFSLKVADYKANNGDFKYLGDKPAIIDFYATWCGPCKVIAPILDKLAKEYDGEIVIYKVDIDKEPELAQAFGITSIPALLFIPIDGKPKMINGSRSKSDYVEIIDKFLLKK